ncbi:MAG: OST-HTH/LOTUS domain-containing protein, partial [Rhodocyclaceae bacterium]|nr:OST-HTH/LOTUS domain-containing protein [Rhodocyclaceae bacterium]
MTVYRCKCGAVAETTQAHGSETVCANCQSTVQVYDTVLYIKSLLQKYSAVYQQLRKVQAEQVAANGEKETGGRADTDAPRLPAEMVGKIKGLFAERQKIKVASLATEIQKILPDFDQTKYGFKKKFSDFVRQCDFLEVRGEKHDMAVSLKKAGANKAVAVEPVAGGLNDTDLFA